MKYKISSIKLGGKIIPGIEANDIENLYDKFTNMERCISSELEIESTSAKHENIPELLYEYRRLKICTPKDDFAIKLNKFIKEQIDSYKNILSFIVKNEYLFDWDIIKDFSKYNGDKPLPPSLKEIPSQPKVIEPVFNLREKIWGGKLKRKKIHATNEENEKRYQEWLRLKEGIEKNNADLLQEYEFKLKHWEKCNSDFIAQQKEKNLSIDRLRWEYHENKSAEIIKRHSQYVLRNIQFPSVLNYKIKQNDFRVFYNQNSQILIVDFQLIPKEDFIDVKDIRYVKTQDSFKEVNFSVREFNLLYDTYIYQMTFTVIHSLFRNDIIDKIESIVFNGWVNATDKATGKKVNKCILSVKIPKKEFLNLNLSSIDAKECFKHLKGISSSKLYELIPVAPILTIDKTDKRFVQSYDVVKELDESINLAAMDWEDFEHLVRELFEEEFSQNGGEVKITRASRDGGVDAIAFG
ncbi:MAG: restriction endonuclease, partial [Actinobacteria bacterium]|nr:restriction endonuclease [Actinomycetota bacterium]